MSFGFEQTERRNRWCLVLLGMLYWLVGAGWISWQWLTRTQGNSDAVLLYKYRYIVFGLARKVNL
jgi:hypothetical protein